MWTRAILLFLKMADIIIPYKHVFKCRLALSFGDAKTSNSYFYLASTEIKDNPMDKHSDQKAMPCIVSDDAESRVLGRRMNEVVARYGGTNCSPSLCPTYHEPFEVTLHPHAIFKKKLRLNIDLPSTPVRMYACIHLRSQTIYSR